MKDRGAPFAGTKRKDAPQGECHEYVLEKHSSLPPGTRGTRRKPHAKT